MGSSRSTRMVIATVCSLVLVLIQLGFCTEVDYNTGTAGWENAPEASAYSSDSSNINYLPQERNQYGQGVLTPLSKDLSGSSTLGTLFSSEDGDPIYAAEHFPKIKYRGRRRKNKLKKKKRPVLEYYDDYDSEITIGMMFSTDILLLKMMDILLLKLRLPDTLLRVPDMKLQALNMVLRLTNPLRHIMHRVTEEMTMDLTIF